MDLQGSYRDGRRFGRGCGRGVTAVTNRRRRATAPPCPRSTDSSSSSPSPSRRRSCSASPRGCASPQSCWRSSPGSSSARRCSAGSRSTRRSRSWRRSASASCSSSAASRSTSGALRGRRAAAHRRRLRAFVRARASPSSLALAAGGLVETPLLVAIALGSTSLGVLIPVLKDTGRIESGARAARDRRRLDRRLRRDHPALAVLRRRGRPGRDAGADRRAARPRARRLRASCAAHSARCASAPTCSGCRTPRPRSACAARSSCSSASPPRRSSSGSR